jgi:hypothetical protein
LPTRDLHEYDIKKKKKLLGPSRGKAVTPPTTCAGHWRSRHKVQRHDEASVLVHGHLHRWRISAKVPCQKRIRAIAPIAPECPCDWEAQSQSAGPGCVRNYRTLLATRSSFGRDYTDVNWDLSFDRRDAFRHIAIRRTSMHF